MKSSLIISFLIHIIILFILNLFIDGIELEKSENPSLDVSILDISDSQKELSLSLPSQIFSMPPLGIADTLLGSYIEEIKGRIYKNWLYPVDAIRNGKKGRVEIWIKLKRDGTLKEVSLTKDTSCELLNREALNAIYNSSPFSPFPKGIDLEDILIHIVFEYR
ncbi:MAG TPA: TonB family protein [Desulfobacteraceae bacterium]|nr:TonB family protein [Desulfobacteraceae bacterium]